jgi:hypothetical protein
MLSLATYRSTSGRDEVAEWFEDLDEEDQARVWAALRDLVRTPREKWDRPEYGHLKGNNWKGFFEIILKPSGIQIRLIGYWRTDEEFVIVKLHNKNKSGGLTTEDSRTVRKRKEWIESDPTRAGGWIDEKSYG